MHWAEVALGGLVGAFSAAVVTVIVQHIENRTERLITVYSDWLVALHGALRVNGNFFADGAIHLGTMERLTARRAAFKAVFPASDMVGKQVDAAREIENAEEGAYEAGRNWVACKDAAQVGEGSLRSALQRVLLVENVSVFRTEVDRLTKACLRPVGVAKTENSAALTRLGEAFQEKIGPIVGTEVGTFIARLIDHHGMRGWDWFSDSSG